jgi:O-antigen/teichoic acid export membrane protein
MKSAIEVGLYTTAQRLITFLAIVPSFIGISIFPILSRNENDVEKLGGILSKVMKIILAIGIPLAIGGIIFSRQITLLVLGGQYISVAPVFSILMISILATFSNIFLINLIFTKNLQRFFILATSIGVFLNIFINFLLIPKYGAVGAAISTTLAEFVILSINWGKLKKFIPFNVVSKLGKVVIASIIMTIVLLILNLTGIHFLINILIGIIVYFLSLKILKEQAFKEILMLTINHQ